MPRIPFQHKLEEFIEREAQRKDLTDSTISHYRTELGCMREYFKGRKPSALSVEDIREYTDQRYKNLKPSTIQGYWSKVRNFLRYCGNSSVERIEVKSGDTHDRDVYWLSEPESAKVRETVKDMDGMYEMLFHLGRDLGMRRVEMMRLKWKNINRHLESINIHGKYDKWRVLYFTPITKDILENWKDQQKKMLERARKYDENAEMETDHVLMWQRWGRVGNPEKTTMANRLEDIEEKSGVEIYGFHTLRRTFARFKFNQGVPLKTLRDLLGHESVEVTERYIGIQQDKKREACNMPVRPGKRTVQEKTPSGGRLGAKTMPQPENSYFSEDRQRG